MGDLCPESAVAEFVFKGLDRKDRRDWGAVGSVVRGKSLAILAIRLRCLRVKRFLPQTATKDAPERSRFQTATPFTSAHRW